MIYTYAILRPCKNWDAPLPHAGIIPEVPVLLLREGDLAAAVSPVPADEFGAEALAARLREHDWLHDRVVRHQQVLAELLGSFIVLPLKFGTMFTDEARVAATLSQRAVAFAAALDRLAGAAEWGVKLFCDRQALAAWVANASPELAPLHAQVEQASAGAAYMLGKKLARAAEQATERALSLAVQGSHQRLAGHTRAAIMSAPQPPQLHGRPSDMALNGTYLVPAESLDAFRAELVGLEQSFGPRGFAYELTGPWPPYSFASIEG